MRAKGRRWELSALTGVQEVAGVGVGRYLGVQGGCRGGLLISSRGPKYQFQSSASLPL